jgi:lambda family phage tail tape measure protein
MDIASLGISIDTSDVAKASTDLDKLVDVGEKAEKAADGVSTGFKKTADAADKLAEAETRAAQATADAKARLLETANTSLKNSEYYQRLTNSVASTASAMDVSRDSTASLLALQKRMQAESDALVGTTQNSAKAAKDAAAATGVQAEGLDKLLNKLNPARKAQADLNDDLKTLSAGFKAGKIDLEQYTAEVGKVNAKIQTLNGNGSAFDKLNLGTRQAQENVSQLANAIATGDLNSGARAIAQVGAGAGSSAIQLGKMLLPAAALVAVLGSIAHAFIDAERESSAFNKAIFAGGNIAGVSSQQLQQIAKEAGDVTHNFAGAKDAALALASSGKVTQSQLLSLTAAAAAISTLTGKGANEVATSLAGLGSSASEAAAKISEQYGLITSDQYLAIKAVEDNGDAQKALDALSEDLNQNAQERLKQYRASLSDIELGWDDIKNSITRAYAAVKSEVFPDLAKQIEIVQRVLDTRKAGGVAGALSNGLSSLNSALGLDDGDNDDSTAALEKKLASLKTRQKASQDAASATGEENAANKELIAVQRDLDRQLDNVNPLAKREAAIKKLNDQFTQLYQDAAKTGQKSPLLSGVDFDGKAFSGGAYDKLLAGINTKNKDAKGPANQLNLTGFNDAQNNLKSITGYYQNLEKELDSAQKAGLVSAESYSSQRVAIVEQEKGDLTAAYEAEIAALQAVRDKSSTTGEQRIQLDQKIADAHSSMVKAQKDADSQLEVLANNETGRIDKQTRSIDQYVQALDQQQKALELAGQRAVLGVGRGDRQNALDGQLNSQQDRFAQQALDLANQKSDPSRNMSDEEFAKKSQALADANKKATDQIRQNYADVQTAQGDWTNGATSAWENYLDSAKDVAGQTKTLFTNAFSNMEDAVANFALTGKLSFSDFTKSVISDLARIATRQATSGVLSTLFGIGATAAGSYSGGASTGSGASSGFDYSLGSASSGLSYGGGRATGGNVAPNSLYQVNEVGPELFNQGGKSYLMTGANGGSVTPLGSGAASVSAGAGGSSPIAVSIQISGDGTSQVSSNTSGMEQFGAEIGRFVEARYKQLEAKSLGPQGNIRKAINGRA